MSGEKRLQQLVRLIDREDAHLLAVRRRLLDDDCHVNADRMQGLVDDAIGIDRLESFGAKFARMQPGSPI
jgi:hypothetical protein